MAGKHRTTNRAKAATKVRTARRRAHQRHIETSTWLGTGAVTLGLGAALASGTGLAHADTAQSGTPAGSTASGSHSTGSTGSTGGSGGSTGSAGSTSATVSTTSKHGSTTTHPGDSSSTGSRAAAAATTALKHAADSVSMTTTGTKTLSSTGTAGTGISPTHPNASPGCRDAAKIDKRALIV
jgi:hypothetical protein